MPKILVTVGVSGSGKSTWAKSYIEENPNTIRVSRDKLREMLYSYEPKDIVDYYSSPNLQEREKAITNHEDNIIKNALIKGHDLLVDATHLDVRYCNRFKNFAVFVEYKVFDAPLQVCLDRDANRERCVGKAIIKKQYEKFVKLKANFDFNPWVPGMSVIVNKDRLFPICVIFDIDGTLAIKGNRSPH